MDKKNNMTLLLPKNLNLEKILQEHPPNFKYKPQFFYYFVNLIYQIPLRYANIDCPDGYVPFSSKKLKRKVNSYKRYLKYLMEQNILKPDNHYIVTEKCKGYRLTEEYAESEPIEVVIKASDKFEESIRNEHRPNPNAIHKYPYLYKWFNENLQIDERAAMAYIDRRKEEEISINRREAFQNHSLRSLAIKSINEHDYWFTAKGRDKRLHTNLTSLKSELRNFITYNGEKLVTVDISNSQPYLSIKLIDKYLKPSIIEKLKQKIQHIFFPPSFQDLIPPHLQPSTNLLKPFIMDYDKIVQNTEYEDVAVFKKLVERGTFYKVFAELLKNQFGDNYFTELKKKFKKVNAKGEPVFIYYRPNIKEIMFEVLYSSNDYYSKEKKLFKEIFSTVDEVYRYHKRKENNRLAIKLQRMEASIVLDKVCKQISRENPAIPLLTIHDSITTTLEHKRVVWSALEDELRKQVKYPPKLKYEYWNPENAD